MKSKVALNLRNLPVRDKMAKIQTAITKCTANPEITNPTPSPASMQTELDAVVAKFDGVDAKEVELQAERADAYAALDAISDKYGLLGACVESKSGGDAAIIGRAGFDVAATRTPIGPLGRVMDLVLSESDHFGALDWMCKPLRGASAYELWISADPMSETSWKFADTATKSSGTLKNLKSGELVWVQVRGKGAAPEPGEFSDPAKKVVP